MSGLIIVFKKELADHLTSWRFIILFAIVFAVGILAIYIDALHIRAEVVETRFLSPTLYYFWTSIAAVYFFHCVLYAHSRHNPWL